jgi:tetratricopeptide (TPR) repeat protein
MKKYFIIYLLLLLPLPFFAQTYEELVERSADYIEENDYFAAEQVLVEALRKDPANQGNTLLLTNLGTVQRHLGKIEEAIVSYSAALSGAPSNTFILHNRAALYCEKNDWDNALKDYNGILLIDEKDMEAYYRRGLLQMEKNDLPAAIDNFQKITELDEDNMLGRLGEALVAKKQNNWQQAEEIYTEAIYKYKSNASLYFYRAECYANLDRNKKALDDLSKAEELGYKDPILYLFRGQVRLEMYDKFSAKIDFNKAKELGADPILVDSLLKKCD